MMLVVFLLFLSVVIQLILIYLLVRKYDEEMMDIGIIKNTRVEDVEYFEFN